MATARKTPAKRPASVSDASGATKRTRSAQTANTQRSMAQVQRCGRKTALRRATMGAKPTRSAARQPKAAARVNRAARASSGHGEAEALPAKGNGRAVAGDGASAQALVARSVGEVVRKSRVVTADAAVPVQIGGLTREVVRPDYWDRACADLMKRDRILEADPDFGELHLDQSGRSVLDARALGGRSADFRCSARNAIWERVKSDVPGSRIRAVHPARPRGCRPAICRSAGRIHSRISRSISNRARCTSMHGRRWTTKP